MCKYLFLLLVLFESFTSFSQGKLVFVGGGSEDYGSWSDLPYQWAVDQSVNKKVAVISYSDQSEWIPEYFVSLGALEAKNIKIDSRTVADLQSTYDELMKYDVFFFKGGDQSKYYEYYRGTKTSQATIDKFNNGGVISGTSAGMAILSGVVFTATRGSVYPDQALSDFNTQDITLADDMFPFLPGYLADSHFTERGRIGRLLAFMANWQKQKNELIIGIGIDDRTALCVAADHTAQVYGTGAVSFYTAEEFSAYRDSAPVADSIHVVSLLHGHSIDLNTLEIINGPKLTLIPPVKEETGNYQVLLSGCDGFSSNSIFLNQFIQNLGDKSDTIAIITAPGRAGDYTQEFDNKGIPYIRVETNLDDNLSQSPELRNRIKRLKKILFVENNDQQLFDFLEHNKTGSVIKNHLSRNHIISGFIGKDSRYAGQLFVTNYLNDPYSAYYGDLMYQKGLQLLKTSIIMSNTFDENSTDYYENTTASVPYGMVYDSLKYGIYLNGDSYLQFSQEKGKNRFSAEGDQSALILANPGTLVEYASQPVDKDGDSRNYVGFAAMKYTLLNGTSMVVGEPVPSEDEPYQFEQIIAELSSSHKDIIRIFPNPTQKILTVELGEKLDYKGIITVTNSVGQEIISQTITKRLTNINLEKYPSGTYVVYIRLLDGTKIREYVVKH